MLYFGLWIIGYCTCLLGMNAVNVMLVLSHRNLNQITITVCFFIYSQTTDNLVAFIQFLVCALIILTDVSLFCLFGQETTENYEDIYRTMCSHLMWYEFPLDIQKLIPLILVNAEEPVYLKGYFALCCTRDFMKSVSNRIDCQ